ncbi:MAG: head-tail connector protein [Pseudomonadota bacterium]
MTVLQIQQPSVEPVSLADAKEHLRIDTTAEDSLISALIVAARSHVEAVTGVTLIHQTFRQYLSEWPSGTVSLARFPAVRVEAVTSYDRQGDPHDTMAAAGALQTMKRPAELALDRAAVSVVDPGYNGVEIDFVAGYGATSVDVPPDLRRAVLMLVSQWYEFRGAIAPHQQAVSVPDGFDALIAPHRLVRL